MITAQNANTSAIESTGDLRIINSLVTDASNQGLYSITVEGNRMNDSMMIDLIDNYGYKVDKFQNDMGTYPRYKIYWDSADIESTFPNYIFLWDFANIDSYTGGSDVNDISGNGDSGTIHNSPVNENGYIKLVGANSQYLINNNDLTGYFSGTWPNRSTKFSLVMSIYPTGNGVIANESSLNGWHNTILEMVGGTLKFSLWDNSLRTITSSIATPFNKWYNVVLTYDGTTMSLYINNQIAGSRTITRTEPYNLNPAKPIYYAFGAADGTNSGDGGYGDFYLGRVELLDAALSGTEIGEKYNFHVSRYGA